MNLLKYAISSLLLWIFIIFTIFIVMSSFSSSFCLGIVVSVAFYFIFILFID